MLLLVPFLCMLLLNVGEDRLMLCLKIHSYTSLLHLGSGCSTLLGTKPECSPNFAMCNHQLENAKSIKHGLTQSAGSVWSVRVLVFVKREPGKHECRRLLHFFSQEQEGIIMSDWISSHDVCNTICWHMVDADCSFSLPHFTKWSWK